MKWLSVLLALVLACALSCAYPDKLDWYLVKPTNSSAATPLPRYHHGASTVGNTSDIVIVGGFDFFQNGEFLNDTWVFQTHNKTWRYVNSSSWTNLTNRAYFTALPYHFEVVAFGGLGPNGTVHNDVWRFRQFRWEQDTYHADVSNQTKFLLLREYHASAIVGDIMYVFGGHSAFYGYTTNELFAYNLTNRNWTLVNNISSSGPKGRQGHTLNAWRDPVYGDSLILFGGYSDSPFSSGYNDAWLYAIKDNKWYQFSSVGAPTGRSGHASGIKGNSLYIQGGFSIKSPLDEYYGDTWSLTLNGGTAAKWSQVTADSTSGLGRRQGHEIVSVNNTLYSVGGYVQYEGLDIDVYQFVDM